MQMRHESDPEAGAARDHIHITMHHSDGVDVDAWSDVWWSGVAKLEPRTEEYYKVESFVSAQLGLHPAIRPVDGKDLDLVMELLGLIGKESPYLTTPRSIVEQYQHEQWERFKMLGQLMGRQIVRKTLDDADAYAAFRIEQERAGTDYLTGVLNRRGFARYLESQYGITDESEPQHEERVAPLERARFTYIYSDANRFKWLNDNLGHHIGDAAIVEIAWELQELFRQADAPLVYRHGGDEFGIVIEGLADDEADAIVERAVTSQIEKVMSGRHHEGLRAIADRIEAVKAQGQRPRIEVKQEVRADDESAPRPYHVLYINGVPVAELRDIFMIAIGAKSAPVSSLNDVESLRVSAEDATRGAKLVLHGLADGKGRTN